MRWLRCGLVAMWVGEGDVCGLGFSVMGMRHSLEPDTMRHPVRMGRLDLFTTLTLWY